MRPILHRILTASLVVAALAVGIVIGRHLDLGADRLPTQSTGPVVAHELVKKDGGYWGRRRDENPADADEALDTLRSLAYVTGSRAPAPATGVTVHDPERTAAGHRLYSSAHAPEAYVIAVDGRVLHRWRKDRDEVWPELAGSDLDGARRYFRRVRLLENGDLLAIFEYTGIIRLDASSRLLWAHRGRNHHALDIDAQGRIHVLGLGAGEGGDSGGDSGGAGEGDDEIPPGRRQVGDKLVFDETITVIAPDGSVVDTISILDCIANSRFAPLLDELRSSRPTPVDLLHPNSLQILDGSCERLSPAFRAGNILTSFRNLSTIAVIDPRARTVVWALSRAWRYQHEPVLLPDCRLLLFDNHAGMGSAAEGTRWSRVVELDPLTQQVVWSHRGSTDEPFFSSLMGAVQRLANGNTLVTESDFGRAFEVTTAGEIVWQFESPHLTGEKGEFVAVIPEMRRIPAAFTRDLVADDR